MSHLLAELAHIGEQFSHTDMVVRQFPVAIFESDFVPKLVSDDFGENKQYRAAVVSAWVAVAGSYSAPVDLVDQGGKVVHRVPPLQTSTMVPPNATAALKMASSAERGRVMAQVNQQANVGELAQLADVQPSQVRFRGFNQDWQTTLAHFAPSDTTAQSVTTAVVDSPATVDETEFNFIF